MFALGFVTNRFIYFGIHHSNNNHQHQSSSTGTNNATKGSTDDFRHRDKSDYNVIRNIDGPFTSLQLQGNWGQRPLLVRNAFPSQNHQYGWPSWDNTINWSCYDDRVTSEDDNTNDDKTYQHTFDSGESARFIQHVPGKLDSFTLDVGPFDRKKLQRQISTASSTTLSSSIKHRTKPQKAWTLLLNDVERYFPPLDTWMNEQFHFIPRWRRDDAQISCTTINGGIGPHVDNYDVCLIQISGKRLWRILLVSPHEETMSHILEQQLLIPNIPVSVLNIANSTSINTATTQIPGLEQSQWIEFLLDEGDMLYLPPRYVHWGLGQSTDCMTLSVGARAPSASDLLIRITEHIQQSRKPLSSLNRYRDDINNLTFLKEDRISRNHNRHNDSVPPEQESQYQQSTLSTAVKQSMKALVQNVMEDIMNDDLIWDTIVGKLITDPLRYSDTFPIPFTDYQQTPDFPTEWENFTPHDVLNNVLRLGDEASLQKVAGISSVTSQIIILNQSEDSKYTIVDRLYVQGEMYEVFTMNPDNSFNRVTTIA